MQQDDDDDDDDDEDDEDDDDEEEEEEEGDEYQRRRRERIEENNRMLVELGLISNSNGNGNDENSGNEEEEEEEEEDIGSVSGERKVYETRARSKSSNNNNNNNNNVEIDDDDDDDIVVKKRKINNNNNNNNESIKIKLSKPLFSSPTSQQEQQQTQKPKRTIVTTREREQKKDLHRVHILCNIAKLQLAIKLVKRNITNARISLYLKPSQKIDMPKLMDASYEEWKRIVTHFNNQYFHQSNMNIKEIFTKPMLLAFRPTVLLFAIFCIRLGMFVRLVKDIIPIPFKSSTPKSVIERNGKDYEEMWIEVFCTVANKWIAIDPERYIIGKPNSFWAPKSLFTYVLALDIFGILRDVTARYTHSFSNSSLYRDENWFQDTVARLSSNDKLLYDHSNNNGIINMAYLADQNNLRIHQGIEGFPTTLAAFKQHPKYVLERFMGKFEAIYPPNTKPVGIAVGGFPIYLRSNVYQLFPRQAWIQQGRVLRDDEINKPYRMFETNHITSANILDGEGKKGYYGIWQTDVYKPPKCENGIVPKNKFGNVEVYPRCPLPEGTVHLRGDEYEGLIPIAKRLHIDFAPAMVGWERIRSQMIPKINGVVVAIENSEVLKDAFREVQEKRKRDKEYQLKFRIRLLWAMAINKVLISNRFKKRYRDNDNVDNDVDDIFGAEEYGGESNNNNNNNNNTVHDGSGHRHVFVEKCIDKEQNIFQRTCTGCNYSMEFERFE